MSKKNTIQVRAPRDVISKLRIKYPQMSDESLIRAIYGTSLMRVELGVDNLDKRLSEVLGVKKKTK